MGDSNFHPGHMDIREQRSTYDLFMGLTKWGSLLIASLLVWLVVWLCADAGLLVGAACGLLLLVAGFFFLRNKPKAAGH